MASGWNATGNRQEERTPTLELKTSFDDLFPVVVTTMDACPSVPQRTAVVSVVASLRVGDLLYCSIQKGKV